MKSMKGREETERTEETTLKQIIGELPEKEKKWLTRLIEEYYQQTTPEAQLVKQIDKAEMILQAARYTHEGTLRKRDAAELITPTLNEIKDTKIKMIINNHLTNIKN